MRTTPLLAAAAALLCTALPAPADAAIRETAYDVVFEAEMVERWSVDEHQRLDCQDGTCVRDATGAGSARIHLKTSTPKRVSVMTGAGRQPMIQYAIDSGIPLKGSYRRAGTYTDIYGGAWDAANTDFIADTSGCGNHLVKTDVSLVWKGRNKLAPLTLLDTMLACPTGSPRGFDYEGVPSVNEIAGTVAETKFGRTRQFTVRGTQTWAGTMPVINRQDPGDMLTSNGQSEIRWSWSATFRMVKKKKRRR